MYTYTHLQASHQSSLQSAQKLPFISYFGRHFLFQSVVSVAGGATRAAVIQHQALDNNMADLSAKDGSQVLLHNDLSPFC